MVTYGRTKWLVAFAGAGVLTLSACGGSGASPSSGGESAGAVSYKMARFTGTDVFYASEVSGALSGLNLEPVEMDSGPAALPLLVNGTIGGMADVAAPPIAIAFDKNIPLRIVWVSYTPGNSLVGKGLNSVADLKGKKVGAPGGSIVQELLEQYLKKNGMDLTSIQFVDLAAPDLVSAYANGAIDAAYIWDPQRAQLVAKGATILDTEAIPNFHVFSADFIKQHPDAVQKFVCSQAAVQNKLITSPQPLWDALGKNLKMEPAAVAKLLPSDSIVPPNDVVKRLSPDGVDTASIVNVAQFLGERKQVNKVLTAQDLQGMVDLTFAKAVAAGKCP